MNTTTSTSAAKALAVLALALSVPVFASAQSENAPNAHASSTRTTDETSLGDVARQQAVAHSKSKRVYTNEDLEAPAPPVTEADKGDDKDAKSAKDSGEGKKPAAAAAVPAASASRSAASEWNEKLAAQRARVADLEKRATQLQDELKYRMTAAQNSSNKDADMAAASGVKNGLDGTLQLLNDERTRLQDMEERAARAGVRSN